MGNMEVIMTDFSRSEMIMGKAAMDKLAKSKVCVFGIGGVGSYVCEALARGGVGSFILVDADVVAPSNINRQVIALNSTIGKAKVKVMRERILDINENASVDALELFYGTDNAHEVSLEGVDYIVDAIDTITSKLLIIEKAKERNISVISSMGTGNKLNASQFKISDIKKTETCPLARVMRRELKKRGINNLKVLWSDEKPIENKTKTEHDGERKQTPGSVSFVPSVAGLLIAGEVIRDLTRDAIE